ncbi:TetR family transcriptional regulator C-terminal domain-containing protein [Streptomyces anulatus]|uniref:TetR family transcriptional regulator C-terminal domain-containing protein n=1 Tax=Streptomyces anulatus TaxID=1892 RepID=A0ABZ1ZSR4_STRAQ|nr:TetR family transcriptional regulator C-terminal domain-containing protein [Streptomyces anulatus]
MLRLTLVETLPLHADARATSRMSAAYVLEALHDEAAHEQARRSLTQGRALVEQLVRQAIADGHIDSGRDPATETGEQEKVLKLSWVIVGPSPRARGAGRGDRRRPR